MGIKYLNKFLQNHCQKSIRKIHMKELGNKTITIDTSILIYQFIAQNALLENMKSLIFLFSKYHIHPLFIFDGKPPEEKQELLNQRKMQKELAKKKYLELLEKHDLVTDLDEKQKMWEQLETLKKQCTRIKVADILAIKELFHTHGVQYQDSKREADELCVFLVQKGVAWGCMSDDTDMFLYGCNHVLRCFDLSNETVLLYDTQGILKNLDMTMKMFREIMVLSGTDYNIGHSDMSLFKTMAWYKKYKKFLLNIDDKQQKLTFYEWLQKYTKYVIDYSQLLVVNNMFCISDNCR